MLEETVVDEAFIAEMDSFRKPKNLDAGLLEACSESVVIFSERMLGIKLYSWQVKFLTEIQASMDKEADSREFAVMTSRQIGKSWAVAIFCVWAAVFNKYPGRESPYNNTVVGVVSASDTQAKKLLEEMKKFLRLGDKHMEREYPNQYPKDVLASLIDDDQRNNMNTVTFKSYDPKKHGEFLLKDSKIGSVVKSYPPTTGVLGETFSIEIIDEAGMTERIEDKFYNEYIYPTGNARDAIRIRLSTPWESSGFFYRLMDPNDNMGENHAHRLMFTIEAIKVEDPGYYAQVMKDIERKRADGLLDEVNRAYYCRFVKSGNSYFDPKHVLEVFDQNYNMVDSYGRPCDLGIDFGGQVKSRTVVTISTLGEDGKVKRLYHHAYQVGQDLSLLDDVADLMRRFKIERVIPDDCPAGDFLIRTMREKGWNVHPMNFRAEKVKKYGGFRAAMNRGELQSYDDNELKIEMLALQYSHGRVQSVIQHAPGESDDLIDSFVMSCYFYIEDMETLKTFDFYA